MSKGKPESLLTSDEEEEEGEGVGEEDRSVVPVVDVIVPRDALSREFCL